MVSPLFKDIWIPQSQLAVKTAANPGLKPATFYLNYVRSCILIFCIVNKVPKLGHLCDKSWNGVQNKKI